jgi:two-component system LytT family response regulator
MTALRVLIVDDEPPARRRLRALCAGARDVEVVGECADGPSAVAGLRAGGVDLVLLDVSLPGLDGLEVVRTLGADHVPAVVFVTARGDHAVAAFELQALDYLLKPFDRGRFEAMLERVRSRLRERRDGAATARLEALLAETRRVLPAEPLVLRTSGRTLVVDPGEIAWAEAADNYVRVHLGTRTALVRGPLSALASLLTPLGFLRIHRSRLVNPRAVRELRPRPGGEIELVLRDGTVLLASRARREAVERRWRGDARV